MPVWVAIASSGARSTDAFLKELHGEHYSDHKTVDQEGYHVFLPTKRDFIMSIIFIVFGVVAATVGVISNIYVQVNGIFFSPH